MRLLLPAIWRPGHKRRVKTKASSALSMRDRMSHLSYAEALKLLGPDGKALLISGGEFELSTMEDLVVTATEARVTLLRDTPMQTTARIKFESNKAGKLRIDCDRCPNACEHAGALLSLLLECKTDLGLAAPPTEINAELTMEELIAAALDDRKQRAETEEMTVRSDDRSGPWTDYAVTSGLSGKTYRVALRSEIRGDSYCSCPDFRINTLGVCKHIFRTLAFVRHAFSKAVRAKPHQRKRVTIGLRYHENVTLWVAMPHAKIATTLKASVRAKLHVVANRACNVDEILQLIGDLQRVDQACFVTPDAEAYIERELTQRRLATLVNAIRKAPSNHALRKTLLRQPLLPYQLDGIAFAVGAGRAILADEMGLGKTIQGVGVAELLAREVGIRRVLIICPASLKSQWRAEIEKFAGRNATVVAGALSQRVSAYSDPSAFYTICNYEQVLRDIEAIEQARWDLIILDEGQRIKNWQAKTSRVVKGLRSRFALVLTGTPLENRLDDLHSVAEFVDPHALGADFRFFHQHRKLDEHGKLAGYKDLDALRKRLAPILLRRTRASVKLDLPPRTVEIVRVAPTAEQLAIHNGHMQTVAQIVRKRFFTEMDLVRLRIALLMARMSADSTFLVTKEPPGHSSKLERLGEMLDQIAQEPTRKVLLFSEWTTMLDLIEPMLTARKMAFVRLDGSVPQKKRQAIVSTFQRDASCRFFLTSNAGSTGLNLQAANTVINIDLPWNPAVLEQRIARAHRMGQTKPVAVYVMVTEQTIEEQLLGTLAAKRDLALAALDVDSTVDEVSMQSGGQDLKNRLEVLLGAMPTSAVSEVAAAAVQSQIGAARGVGSTPDRLPVFNNPALISSAGSLLLAAKSFWSTLTTVPTHTADDSIATGASTGGVKTEISSKLGAIGQALKLQIDPPSVESSARVSFTMPDPAQIERVIGTIAGIFAQLSSK
jgi:superfamily II DNA or RNA helicase